MNIIRSRCSLFIHQLGTPYSHVLQRRHLTIAAESTPAFWPTIPSCPTPNCPCADTPTGLNIKRDGPMAIPQYSRHVVLKTGRSDWASKIENEESTVVKGADVDDNASPKSPANMAKVLKDLTGPGGKYHVPGKNILITNSSLPDLSQGTDANGLYIFPQGIHISRLANNKDVHDLFVRQFLLDHEDVPTERVQLQEPATNISRNQFIHLRSFLKSPMILICSHNSRDTRCGILGPLLLEEFNKYVATKFHKKSNEARFETTETQQVLTTAMTASISHIGGHAWAGNVIIYFPPKYRDSYNDHHPLAGKGVWYGRVEPRHVEGVVDQTIRDGTVIEELLRGVHHQLGSTPFNSLPPITDTQEDL